jgi:hypothetical protein
VVVQDRLFADPVERGHGLSRIGRGDDSLSLGLLQAGEKPIGRRPDSCRPYFAHITHALQFTDAVRSLSEESGGWPPAVKIRGADRVVS